MTALAGTIPILSCAEAGALETKLFAGDETREWEAMRRAGRAIAEALLTDAKEVGGLPPNARLLVLVGKGHNGGDALIAATSILRTFPQASADVLFVLGERALRPLAAMAWRELAQEARARVRVVRDVSAERVERGTASRRLDPEPRQAGTPAATRRSRAYDLCLDGIFGFQFRPPAEPAITELLAQVNALPVGLRVAVDLPSAGLFQSDFTYCTGSVKAPVLGARAAGRARYLDLEFFEGDESGMERVLTRSVLSPLAALRSPHSDKRTYGHLFVVGGSRSFPGAVLMTVLAALRSGVGLVTAFVPESVVSAFAARAPEAMWVGWPETPSGGLALDGEHLLRERLERASALAIGPGLSREPESLALVASIVQASPVPLVLDADALQPNIVGLGNAPRILTPHAGELARIGSGPPSPSTEAANHHDRIVVEKGPVTRVRHGTTTYHSLFGGPVLARGGSGDLLAGLTGGLLAQTPDEPLLAAARGVVWHGLAADHLAQAFGQTPVSVTQLLDFLPAALRASCA